MNESSGLTRLARRTVAKMNGIGNAIVVLDLRDGDLVVSAEEARAIAAAPGLFFDQLMVIHHSREPGTDADLRIYNTDGSLSGACGNGTRCVAWFMLRGSDRDSVTLTTTTARVACRKLDPLTVSVDMGQPLFRWDQIPLRDAGADPKALQLDVADAALAAFGHPFAVGMGNPHCVFFVPDTDAVDLVRVGPPVEHAPVFPERANVSFAEVLDDGTIKLRVWERGAGETLGCGTGACATLVAAASTGRTGRAANVDLPGGRLAIVWRDDGHVIMTGPVELEFEAELGALALGDRAA